MTKFFYRLAFIGSLWGLSALSAAAVSGAGAKLISGYMQLPAGFEANRGQAPKGVDFVSVGVKRNLYLSRQGLRLDSAPQGHLQTLRMDFAHGSSGIHGQGLEPLKITGNYFYGPDPAKWIRDVPNYTRVRYQGVWPGIDVVYYGNQNRLEYDVVVAPGADPKLAAISFQGARKLRTDSHGDLLIETASGELVQRKPVAYQITREGRKEVASRYVIRGRQIGFEVGAYDRSAELTIDPVMLYSFPVIDPGYMTGTSAAADTLGNAYFAGTTVPMQTSGLPTLYNTAWVASVDVGGNPRYKFTLAAVDGPLTAAGIAEDSATGAVYLTGTVTEAAGSQGIPIAGAFQTTAGGGTDAFLEKIIYTNNRPNLLYGTYIGGSGSEAGNAIKIDNAGTAYVAGNTSSGNFPNVNGGVLSSAGGTDAFVVKINTTIPGSASLTYAFLAGGSGNDSAQAIALDANNNLYVAGNTASTNFLPASPLGYITGKTSGTVDGFLLKTNASSPSALSYLTFYQFGPFNALAVDSAGNAYVAGTSTGLIPTNSVNAGYSAAGGANHAFVTRFNTTVGGLNSLVYTSYLAGGLQDSANGVGIDASGVVTVAGSTNSPNFPIAGSPAPPFSTTLPGIQSGFISRLNTNVASTPSLLFSAYFGGNKTDSINAMTFTQYNNPLITGATTSTNFPASPGASEPSNNSIAPTAFVAKIALEAAPFGIMDTPANNTANATGAVNVTGWALSTIGIANIGLYRDPVAGETPGPSGLVFLGNAAQVPGARPDVAQAYPGYPNNNYGWGAQVLTNELPGTGGRAIGNGTYKFHAIASDSDGLSAEVGASTITANNSTSTVPFGAIDTPATGGVASGSAYINFGWAVTPLPGTIPKDGSTITVYIDNAPVGHPTYNQYRSDIATLFPGLNNSGVLNQPASGGAVGFYTLDTTKLANGLHTIAWVVTDNQGRSQGIGSRQFIVQN